MRARWPLLLAAALFLFGAARDIFDAWVDATEMPDLVTDVSTLVTDREGRLLRAYHVDDGRWRLPVSLDAVDPLFIEMLVAYEDKRFWTHSGVDLRAMARATGQALWNGEVVSGGSTLTMQVARLLEDSGTGRLSGKLRQIRLALALERRLTKEQILGLYLLRAPYGGNIEGLRAASLAWFGREPGRLTAAEAALLVALPQSPETRRPDRNPDAAAAGRARVLARMGAAGVLAADRIASASRAAVPAARQDFPAIAPHLADRVAAGSEADVIPLTLDRDLQISLERLAAEALRDQDPRAQVAILVADHRSGAILASVGSASYQADLREGFVDMTRALRSPGSTLKPFVYALAFDRGLAHPETLIDDRPTDFSGYAPQNFDGEFRGELRIRRALQLSLNLPVVSLLDALGPAHLLATLRRGGAAPELPGGDPGLAIGLGGIGITLEDLTGLYAGLAQGGLRRDLYVMGEEPPRSGARFTGAVAAWYVTDILEEAPRPRGVRGAGIAFKTGTSYGYRDAWSVGFDGAHVVGVWMGRPDGTPVPGAFGAELAAPVMFAAFERLGPVTPLPRPPDAAVIAATADLPPPLRRFRPAAGLVDTTRPAISFPPDGAVLQADDTLMVRVREGLPPFTWLADGRPVAQTHDREYWFESPGQGFTRLSVIDAEGRSASTRVELRGF